FTSARYIDSVLFIIPYFPSKIHSENGIYTNDLPAANLRRTGHPRLCREPGIHRIPVLRDGLKTCQAFSASHKVLWCTGHAVLLPGRSLPRSAPHHRGAPLFSACP